LWGNVLEPPRYDLVSWTFLRGLGLIYLAAFASLGVQILGLVGSGGISCSSSSPRDGCARRLRGASSALSF
ncbi:MAG TPA: hypothetical protein VEN29_16895, partial [Casimicrobiaceae bacterium]|nr:hypothetical protein [Casimicrobiaceae bacterium]